MQIAQAVWAESRGVKLSTPLVEPPRADTPRAFTRRPRRCYFIPRRARAAHKSINENDGIIHKRPAKKQKKKNIHLHKTGVRERRIIKFDLFRRIYIMYYYIVKYNNGRPRENI